MKYGYVRVSTKEQNTDRQLEDMEKENIPKENIFVDKLSGKDMERPQLKLLLDKVKKGDKIVVDDITRLGRNMRDIVNLIDWLDKKEVYVVGLKENVDTYSEYGKMMINLLAALSEMERKNIRERQRQGIEIAKRKGKMTGRPRCKCEDFDGVYGQYINGDISMQQALKLLECSKSTFYRRIREYKDNEIIDY